MFERFTDRACRVVVLAQEEARMKHSPGIGLAHLLAGLVAEGEGVAAIVLAEQGVSLDAVRASLPVEEGEPLSHLPFFKVAKKAIEQSLREALQLGHNYIGTEHLLLALVHALPEESLDPFISAATRKAVIEKLAGYARAQTATPPLSPVDRLRLALEPFVAPILREEAVTAAWEAML